MTVNTFSWMSAPYNASDTAMRKWIQGIHDAFETAGLVQTADTGQIDISTATGGSATPGGVIGYELWEFDDDWQSTCPIVIKIEYSHAYATGGVGRPGLALTVGTASNGSGGIDGDALFTRILMGYINTQGSQSTTEYASYASGDGSSISVILWPAWSAEYALGGFTIERSCGTDGEYTGDAVAISTYYAANRACTVVGCHGVGLASQYARWGALPITLPVNINGLSLTNSTNLAAATLSEDGTTAPVFPIPYAAPGVTPWVSNNIVAITPGDAGATSVIQVATINGQERTYRAFPYVPSSAQGAGGLVTASTSSIGAFPAIAWTV